MRLIGILAVFALLCLPVIQNITGALRDFRIDENRVQAPWPTMSPLRDPVAYVAGAEAWFDDRFGLRDLLIRLKTQIDYSVFATSTRVYVGSDGWLFYRTMLDTEKPVIERLMQASTEDVTAGIADLARGLRERGVQLVLMPIFLADVFYPDKLPADVPHLPQPGAFRLATRQWRTLPGIIYIDSEALLQRVKASRPIFYKTDLHWNDPAAFEVARSLVDQLAAARGDEAPLWDHRLATHVARFVGKESDFLPLFVQPEEQALFLDRTWPDTVTLDRTRAGFEWVSTQTAPGPRTLPALCVVGDSFFDGLFESGVMSFFTHVYRARWTHASTLGTMLTHLPDDCRYLLVEFVETQKPAVKALSRGAQALGSLAAGSGSIPYR